MMLTESQLIEQSQNLKLRMQFNENLSLLTEDQILAREMFLAEGRDPLLEFGLADAWEWAKSLGVGALGLIKKVGMPITAAYEVWQAWEQIKVAKAKNLPREQFKSQVAKIIAKAVGQFGLVWIGALVGGAVAGVFGLTTGPGAIIAAIAGGIGGAYFFSKNVDDMVEGLVDLFYPEGKDKPTDPATSSNNSSAETPQAAMQSTPSGQLTDASIEKIQTALKTDGQKLGIHGVDGKFGKDTFAAYLAYKKKHKLESTPDLEIFMKLAGIEETPAPKPVTTPVKEMQHLSESEKMSSLRQLISELDQSEIDEVFRMPNIRSGVRHGLDDIGITTKGMQNIKNLGTTVELKVTPKSKPQEVWSYDKTSGEYINASTGARKKPADMAAHKEQFETDAAAKAAASAAAKPQPGDRITYPDSGPKSQAYTFDGKTWSDASGRVVKDKSLITHLNGEAVAKRSAAPSTSTTTPVPNTPHPPGPNNPPAPPVPGPARRSWDALKNSKFGKALSNPKVLTLLAALGTLGYLFNRDGNIFSGNGTETPVTPPVEPNPTQSGDPETPNTTTPDATAPNTTAPNTTAPGISDKEANNLMKQNVLPANMQTPAGEFKFTPEQEKWLGGANRQDPYILNRMPGEKPPVSYFKEPEDQQLASKPGMPFAKDAAPVAVANGTAPGGTVATTEPKAKPVGTPQFANESVLSNDNQILARIVDLARR